MNRLSQMVRGRRITQTELAFELGITKSAVSQQIKKGIKNITIAKKYATVLKCNPLFLLD